MIELPEAVVIARQITQTLGGKRIALAVANASPHKFAWYSGDPADYNQRLAGKRIGTGAGVGGHIEFAAGDMLLSISAPIRYHAAGEKRPQKHQLLLEFEDGTAITSSAQMWGGFFHPRVHFVCIPAGGQTGFPDADLARTRPSPLTTAFDRAYFDTFLIPKPLNCRSRPSWQPNNASPAWATASCKISYGSRGSTPELRWANLARMRSRPCSPRSNRSWVRWPPRAVGTPKMTFSAGLVGIRPSSVKIPWANPVRPAPHSSAKNPIWAAASTSVKAASAIDRQQEPRKQLRVY